MDKDEMRKTIAGAQRLQNVISLSVSAAFHANMGPNEILSALTNVLGTVIQSAPDAMRAEVLETVTHGLRVLVNGDYPDNDATGEAPDEMLATIQAAAKRGGTVH